MSRPCEDCKVAKCCEYEGRSKHCFFKDEYERFYEQGRADAIVEFVNKMKKYYWDNDIQSAKDDPCVIDAMIDLAIRTAKEVEQLKEQNNE